MYRSMNIKLLTLTVSALALSTSVNAAILSYGGYTHDTTTDIVTGNDLEWLQWDRTLGYSINSIQSQLNTIEGGGWSIATNVQMAQLFNAFDFGITYVADENAMQSADTGYTYPDTLNETDELFIAMFGDTDSAAGYSSCFDTHCFQRSYALFGTDLDNDTGVNYAVVFDDYQNSDGSTVSGKATIGPDAYIDTDAYPHIGIALVRDVPPVPVPAAVWLFGSGLLGLIGVARRKKA